MVKNYDEQLNVKIPSKLHEDAKEYVKDFGFTNIQELIRDTLRTRIYSEKLNPSYINNLLKNSNFKETIGEKESIELFNEMKRKVANDK